jgi:nicotinamidase-related amidase
LTTNSCITCTAHDANMRDLQLIVPSDCSAARTREEHKQALLHLKNMLGASTGRSTALKLDE